MSLKIDDKTVVPLGIVAALFSVGISVTLTTAFWVRGVNDHLENLDKRFERLEIHLGIDTAQTRTPAQKVFTFIPEAEAKGLIRGPSTHR